MTYGTFNLTLPLTAKYDIGNKNLISEVFGMAKFIGSVKSCIACGEKFRVPPSRAISAKYCSTTCADLHRNDGKIKDKIEIICRHCGIKFYTYPSHEERRVFCSRDCKNLSITKNLSGEKSFQWKGGIKHSRGYVLKSTPLHPFADNGGYIPEHRLVMESWLRENRPDSPYLIKLGDNLYLSPDYIVHHKNRILEDNRIENLQAMTISEHMSYHMLNRNN